VSRDLLQQADVKELVRSAYAAVDADTSAVAETLYEPDQLAGVPTAALSRSLGVNNHLRFAGIRPGDAVLDLGCEG
jgi:arsenite methyltransferase